MGLVEPFSAIAGSLRAGTFEGSSPALRFRFKPPDREEEKEAGMVPFECGSEAVEIAFRDAAVDARVVRTVMLALAAAGGSRD